MRIKKRLKKEWIRQCRNKTLFCYLCGRLILKESQISADHIIPKSQGGMTTRDNLQPAHILCNNIRDVMEVDEFKDKLRNEYNNNIFNWWREIHKRHLVKGRSKNGRS